MLHVAVGEEFEQFFVRIFPHASGQMLDDETGIGDDLVFIEVVAHESNNVPVVIVKLDLLFLGQGRATPSFQSPGSVR